MQQPSSDTIARNFENAKTTYALWGIDVGGFESSAGLTGGGMEYEHTVLAKRR
jgi:hypothetical protein